MPDGGVKATAPGGSTQLLLRPQASPWPQHPVSQVDNDWSQVGGVPWEICQEEISNPNLGNTGKGGTADSHAGEEAPRLLLTGLSTMLCSGACLPGSMTWPLPEGPSFPGGLVARDRGQPHLPGGPARTSFPSRTPASDWGHLATGELNLIPNIPGGFSGPLYLTLLGL